MNWPVVDNRAFEWLLSRVLTGAPADIKKFYARKYDLSLHGDSDSVSELCRKLDSGVGEGILASSKTFRGQSVLDLGGHPPTDASISVDDFLKNESNTVLNLVDEGAKYSFLVHGALMMMLGAKISRASMQILRVIANDCTGIEKLRPQTTDVGFRGPGKRQFLAALDQYKAGVPRDFAAPSCFNCGKIGTDIGVLLSRCSRCIKNKGLRIWFCNEVSQGLRPQGKMID